MSPRPDVSAQRREQILDAAVTVFARQGFHKARMDDIVQESGLSKGTLYWYFEGKDAIISAILRRFFDRELKGLRDIHVADGSASERLLLLGQQVAADFERIVALLPMVYEFYAVALRQETVRATLAGYFRVYREVLTDLIQEGIDRGEFRAVDPGAAAIVFSALYEGLAVLWMVDPQAVRLRELGDTSVQLLLDGIRTKE